MGDPTLDTRRGGARDLVARLRGVTFLLGGVTIFVYTSIPQERMPRFRIPFWDKWAHALAFMAFGVMMWRWLRARAARASGTVDVRWTPRAEILAIGAAAGAWGLLCELHQLIVPGRVFDWYDVAWNAIGGVIGGGCSLLPQGLRRVVNLGAAGGPIVPRAPGPAETTDR